MSWLYSQALVEEYSEACSVDTEQFARLNVMPTQRKFWRNDKTMEHCQLSRFGLTLKLLTESLGEDLLTWYLEVSLARTSALQEQALDSTEKGQDYGDTCGASFARFDQVESRLKTAQCLLFEDLAESCVTLPRWGTMRNGELYQRQIAELPICVKGVGLLPTPTATDYKGGRSPEAAQESGRGANNGLRDFCRLVLGWKKPRPEALEELMGFPPGWTELAPLETHKFHEWQQQHSPY